MTKQQEMRKAILFLLPALLVCSCTRPNPDEASLIVGDGIDEVEIEWSGRGDYQLSVSTNAPGWDYICQAEWLEVERAIDRLILTPEPNNGLTPRQTQLMVVSGGETRTILIRQLARGVYLDAGQTEWQIPYWSDSQMIYVESGVDDWQAESNAEWLTAVAHPYEQRLEVSFEENATGQERVGEVTITRRGSDDEITRLLFTQAPVTDYFLPVLAFGPESRFSDIEPVESARNHELVMMPRPATSDLETDQLYYEFVTDSEVFPRVKYQPTGMGDSFFFKAVLSARDESVFDRPEYQSFMEELGFVVTTAKVSKSTGSQMVYTNEELRVKALQVVTGSTAELIFVPMPDDIPSAPTIDRLYGLEMADFFGNYTAEEVMKYEESAGGGKRDSVWSAALTELLKQQIELYHTEDPFFTRWYFFYDYGDPEHLRVDEIRFMMTHFEMGYYKYGDLCFVNPAFDKLLRANGFVPNEAFRDVHNNYNVYDNAEKNLRIVIYKSSWNAQEVVVYDLYTIYR